MSNLSVFFLLLGTAVIAVSFVAIVFRRRIARNLVRGENPSGPKGVATVVAIAIGGAGLLFGLVVSFLAASGAIDRRNKIVEESGISAFWRQIAASLESWLIPIAFVVFLVGIVVALSGYSFLLPQLDSRIVGTLAQGRVANRGKARFLKNFTGVLLIAMGIILSFNASGVFCSGIAR